MTENEKTKKRPRLLFALLIWQAAALAYSYGASVLNPFEEKPLPTAEVQEKLRSLFEPTPEEIEEAWETIEEIRQAHEQAMGYWREAFAQDSEHETTSLPSYLYYLNMESKRKSLLSNDSVAIVGAKYGYYELAINREDEEDPTNSSEISDAQERESILAELLIKIDDMDYLSAQEILKREGFRDNPDTQVLSQLINSLNCGGEDPDIRFQVVQLIMKLPGIDEFEISKLNLLWKLWDQTEELERKLNILLQVSSVYLSNCESEIEYSIGYRLLVAANRLATKDSLDEWAKSDVIYLSGRIEEIGENFAVAAELFHVATERYPSHTYCGADRVSQGGLLRKANNDGEAFDRYVEQLNDHQSFYLEDSLYTQYRMIAFDGVADLYREQGNYIYSYYYLLSSSRSYLGVGEQCGEDSDCLFIKIGIVIRLNYISLLAGPFFCFGNIMYLCIIEPLAGFTLLAIYSLLIPLLGWLSFRLARRYSPASS